MSGVEEEGRSAFGTSGMMRARAKWAGLSRHPGSLPGNRPPILRVLGFDKLQTDEEDPRRRRRPKPLEGDDAGRLGETGQGSRGLPGAHL